MLTLIKNELYKILHKKSTYIVLIITVLFAILVNVIYNTEISSSYYYSYELDSETEATYQSYVNNFNSDRDSYDDLIYYKTTLEINSLLKKYDSNTWQEQIIDNYYRNIVNSYYYAYYKNKDDVEAIKNYEEATKALQEDDWQYFAKIELEELKANLKEIKLMLENNNLTDKQKQDYEMQVFVAEVNIEMAEYRLKENVKYKSGYLDTAIENVNNYAYNVALYNQASEKEKPEYEASVREFYENKYILDNKEDTNNNQSARAVLMNFFDEYYFLILVFGIMIAGGIVSDEFNKGTIKSLLITPYKRSKILLAKFLTVLLIIPIFIIFGLAVQFIIGGIIFGFDSLSIPVVVYNITSKSLEVINLFKYVLLQFITTLPKVILLTTLAFAFSTIINNTAFAIAVTFCGYIGSEIINQFALIYKVKALNYFVTTNWDFGSYLFGGNSIFGNSIGHAIIVCLVYFAIMVVTSFIVFKKKDIKNI